MTLVLELKPETLRRIEKEAAQIGTTPEEMVVEMVESNFNGESKTDFRAAADYVLHKNAELLRRLA
ncbi:MAG: DNA-binding protein [Armatimonadetes bacterium]|nr:DNA-binding protein [Armatimonadota bacterium]